MIPKSKHLSNPFSRKNVMSDLTFHVPKIGVSFLPYRICFSIIFNIHKSISIVTVVDAFKEKQYHWNCYLENVIFENGMKFVQAYAS